MFTAGGGGGRKRIGCLLAAGMAGGWKEEERHHRPPFVKAHVKRRSVTRTTPRKIQAGIVACTVNRSTRPRWIDRRRGAAAFPQETAFSRGSKSMPYEEGVRLRALPATAVSEDAGVPTPVCLYPLCACRERVVPERCLYVIFPAVPVSPRAGRAPCAPSGYHRMIHGASSSPAGATTHVGVAAGWLMVSLGSLARARAFSYV